MEPIVKNVKQCDYCRGPVDRFESCFQCRNCGSMGDLITGIMEPPRRVENPDHDVMSECPICGGGPLYQDRIDAAKKVAHCDDCGEEIDEATYKEIMEKSVVPEDTLDDPLKDDAT